MLNVIVLALVMQSEFIFEKAPFGSSHASTIVETREGFVAAWFGGTRERDPDVGIWVSRRGASGWTAPVEVANGIQPDGTRHPCWNPVLFETTKGTLALFYKVGPRPTTWCTSSRTTVGSSSPTTSATASSPPWLVAGCPAR